MSALADSMAERLGKPLGLLLARETTESDIDFWAAGVVQNIENAAMDLYVIYRHTDGELSTEGGSSTGLDGFDMVISGARIQF